MIKCNGNTQKVTIVKMLHGFPTIIVKDYKDCRVSELNNQRTRVLNKLLKGETLNRVHNNANCIELPARICEVQKALLKHNILIEKADRILNSGAITTNYSLSKESRKQLESIT